VKWASTVNEAKVLRSPQNQGYVMYGGIKKNCHSHQQRMRVFIKEINLTGSFQEIFFLSLQFRKVSHILGEESIQPTLSEVYRTVPHIAWMDSKISLIILPSSQHVILASSHRWQ
jgi:hypothetical protein